MSRSPFPTVRSSHAFTLVELLVVIGIIALLLSILVPTLARARQAAASTKCLANLRTFGQAQIAYAHEAGGWSVPAIFGSKNEYWPAPNNTIDKRGSWFDSDLFRKHIGAKLWVGGNNTQGRLNPGFACPLATQANETRTTGDGVYIGYSYGYNARHMNYNDNPLQTYPVKDTWNANTIYAGIKVVRVRRNAEKIMFADSMTSLMQPQNSDHYMRVPGYDDYRDPSGDEDTTAYIAYRHGRNKDHVNVAFWDGHAEVMHRNDVVAIKDRTLGGTPRRQSPNWTGAWLKRWDLAAK